MITYIYYAHLASVRFEHSVCRGSLMTTYIYIYIYNNIIIIYNNIIIINSPTLLFHCFFVFSLNLFVNQMKNKRRHDALFIKSIHVKNLT